MKIIKKFLAVFIVITINAGIVSIPASSETVNQDYEIIWQEDFDTGYSDTDTKIKSFDTYESANTLNEDGTTYNTLPDYWDGTYNYSSGKASRDLNSKVIRKLEDGNGMMSFQHVDTGTTNEIYVEKTFDEPVEHIPEIIVEYKVRMTVVTGSYVAFNLRVADSNKPSRLQGPQFSIGYTNISGTKGRINKYDGDDDDNIGFNYGTASSPNYDNWHTVKVVHSNKTNTRKTYLDGVYLGEATNGSKATYYKDGKISLRFEVYCIANTTVIDVDDIVVKAKTFSSSTPSIVQNGAVVSEYEYSDEPVSAQADIINYDSTDRNATIYFSAYGYEGNEKKLLIYDYKTDTIPANTKKTISTDGISLPSGVSEIRAYVWEGIVPLSQSGTAEKYIFESSETGIPSFGTLENLGYVSLAKKTGAATTGYTKDGLRTFIAMVGTPGYVMEFDTHTGEYISSYESGSGLQHCIKVGSDGLVYTMPTSNRNLYAYDPETKVNTLLFEDICEGSTAWHMNYGANDDRSMLYMPVMYSDGYETVGTPVIEYDIDNKKVNVYRGFDPGCKYAHCATGDENYVYVGSSDGTNVATISRMDKETGEIVTYEDDQGRCTGAITFIKVIDDLIFTRISSYLVVIDKNTMEKVNEFEGGRGQYDCVSDPDPDNENLVYYSSNHGSTLRYYNMADNTTDVAFTTTDKYGNYVRYDFGRWFENENGVKGISGVGGSPDCPGIFHLVPGTSTFSHIYSGLSDATLGIPTKPSYFYVSRDDILYTGGYEAGLNGFDLKTNTFLFTVENGNQHGMTMVGNKLFGGCYSSDGIYMFDTSKKVSSTNPKKVASLTGVCRYYNTSDTNAGFGLSVGIADYGGEEGGVILMSYFDSAPQVELLSGVIPGENIIGVAYKDGYIYASSSVNVPQYEAHEEAHVAKINAKTKEVEQTVTVNFDGLSKTTAIGEIRFGPDGLLYGKADAGQTIFALDPDDLSVVKYNSYFPDEHPDAAMIGSTLIFGTEGNLYAVLSGDLYCINIDTMEATKLYGSSSNFCLDNDGNILKRYGTNSLARIYVNQRQRLEIMIKNAEKYYNSEDYSEESWAVFEGALSKAKAINIKEAYLPDVKEAARNLSFAIKDLQTVFDSNEEFGYPLR